jgi:hypothetical protein
MPLPFSHRRDHPRHPLGGHPFAVAPDGTSTVTK